MHYIVEAVARANPASEAVCAWDGSLTYAELGSLSSVAAQRLVDAGVGPGVFVPIAYEKSLWTPVLMLAILKAGGAFVPLSQAHPRQRVKEMVAGVNATIIVTSESLKSGFEGLVSEVLVFPYEIVFVSQKHASTDFSFPLVQPTDPIFVLFTSGSTGQPKGMIHEHGAICTHAITHGEAMGYHGSRVLQFAAHTFDIAVIDIFTTLLFRGCICIPSEEQRLSDICGAINELRADYAILTPSFAGSIQPSDAPTLKTLAFGGEALSQPCIKRWARIRSLLQVYGPAEVGICLMMDMSSSEICPEMVGYTLRNCSCWLVSPDDPHCLVPIGAVGELVVAGPSLARGYLCETATRASFLYHLNWAKGTSLENARFYRTGDLLRYNTDMFDGCYDFIGRKDDQIKLRGQRIEPGEMEHHIANIPDVALSVVTRPQKGCYAGELVAVVQMHCEESSKVKNNPIEMVLNQRLNLDTVKNHMSDVVPGYMIPTVYLEVSNIPFVPSLKIDRKQVKAWVEDMETEPSQTGMALLLEMNATPLNANEVTARLLSDKVATILSDKSSRKSEVLRGHDFVLQRTGIESIQGMSFSMFLRKTFKRKIHMAQLLSPRTTIRDLARLLDQEGSVPNTQVTSPSVNVDLRDECSSLVSGIVSHNSLLPDVTSAALSSIALPNILLTGATGYLGMEMLKRLLERPEVTVFALVRCSSESAGLERIVNSATKAGWWQTTYTSRVQVWKGDLTKPGLGLDAQKLQCLRGHDSQDHTTIHAFIHNGAKVHYSYDYDTLKPCNVQPTVELLKLMASSAHLVALVYISGGQNPDMGPTAKASLSATELDQLNGYAQSKFVSEQIVLDCGRRAAFQSKHLLVVQPGYIVGSIETGTANQSDFIWRLIAGCIEVGVYNRDEDSHWLFLSEVSHVACEAVSGLFDDDRWLPGKTGPKKVLDGLHFSDLWHLLTEDFGYVLEPTGCEEWMTRLKGAVLEKGEEHLLYPLLDVLEKDGGNIGSHMIPDQGEERTARVRAVVKMNVGHLIEVGFLPRPPGEGAMQQLGQGQGTGDA